MLRLECILIITNTNQEGVLPLYSDITLVKCPSSHGQNKAKMRFLKNVRTHYLHVRHKYSTFFRKNALCALYYSTSIVM